uniref:Uncharacterized protein n=1 Tax=Cacopsylla melanoneura TaxID=428564 RepID=A0A8D8Y1G3_9HEMI
MRTVNKTEYNRFYAEDPREPKFEDFDYIVENITFHDFGSNYVSEILIDEEYFEYYEQQDIIKYEMTDEKREWNPEVNIGDIHYYDEYGDFGTLMEDEEQIDFEEYYDSLRYFELLDQLNGDEMFKVNFR